MLGGDSHVQDVSIFCVEINVNLRNFHAYAALCYLSLLSLSLHWSLLSPQGPSPLSFHGMCQYGCCRAFL